MNGGEGKQSEKGPPGASHRVCAYRFWGDKEGGRKRARRKEKEFQREKEINGGNG